MPQMKQRSAHSGFTLLELVLVMMIVMAALALAAPSMGGWGRTTKLRDAGDQFLAVTRWARSQAIADARIYRLNIDSYAGRYWLTMQEGETFVELGKNFGQAFALPEGYRIAIVADTIGAPTSGQTIDFHGNGRVQPARVQIANDVGGVIEIAAIAATDEFALVTPAGGP